MKNNIILLVLLLVNLTAFAQFTEQLIMPTIQAPNYTLTEDIDEDSDIDVVVCTSINENTIIWFENDGVGNFEDFHVLSTDRDGFSALYMEDMNGDELKDLVAISKDGRKVVWFENRKNGNFGLQNTIVKDIQEPENISFADVDNDGDKDVFLFSNLDRNVAFVVNDGMGHFGELQIVDDYFIRPIFGGTADFNGDGKIDIVITEGYGPLFWYENLGNHLFNEKQVVGNENEDNISKVKPADLDKDGDMDLVAISSDSTLVLYENNGVGEFETHTIVSESTKNLWEINISDINDDGWLDILFSSDNEIPRIFYFVNDVSGVYQHQQTLLPDSYCPSIISMADIDGDNRLDLVYVNQGKSRIDWHSQQPDNSFGDWQTIGNHCDVIKDVFSADFNGDSRPDLAFCEITFTFPEYTLEGRFSWLVNKENNSFEEQKIIADNNDGFRNLTGGDFDLDGDIDLASGSYKGIITWWKNDGMGNFEEQAQIDSLESQIEDEEISNDLQAVDLNKDGYLDMVANTPTSGDLYWYTNMGNATFSPRKVIDENLEGTGELHIADINGDGQEDIIYAPNEQNHIYLYQYNNDNTFTKQSILSKDREIRALEVEDFDMDGFKDIVVSHEKNSSSSITIVEWHKNDGYGQFGLGNVFGEQFYLRTNHIELADLDGDSDNDLIIDNESLLGVRDSVYVFINQGDNHFTKFDLNGQFNNKISAFIDVADLDGDATFEILHVNYKTMTVYGDFDNFGVIRGKAFFDQNENGLYEEGEVGFQNIPISLNPLGLQTYSNENGSFYFSVASGDYQLTSEMGTLWELTTPPSYAFSIANGETTEPYLFGFKPTRILPRVETHTNSSPTRCNAEATYWLNYSNTGTTVANGKITLEMDELMMYESADPAPSMIEGTQLIWNIADLYPNQKGQIQLQFQMPNETHLGKTLKTQATVQLFNKNQELVYFQTNHYNSEVRCAYDPNDKLVRSSILGQSQFAPLGDELLYTIRFQNTGNDVAFHVRIEDVLDKKLDWTTFHPITASHDYRTTFDKETGLVVFYFDDIMLLDSTTNEPESHGFVMFGISPLSNLAVETEIDNTASIFFDYNPPIITNTIVVSMIEEQKGTNFEGSNSKHPYLIEVSPNPFSVYSTIEVMGLPQGNYQLQVMDILGRKVRELKVEDRKTYLERGGLESGLYLIQILEENGRILGNGKVLVE
ncbi:MAG: FG-GAP-like repeat-containing protein [Chitinophagales bacterium]